MEQLELFDEEYLFWLYGWKSKEVVSDGLEGEETADDV